MKNEFDIKLAGRKNETEMMENVSFTFGNVAEQCCLIFSSELYASLFLGKSLRLDRFEIYKKSLESFKQRLNCRYFSRNLTSTLKYL